MDVLEQKQNQPTVLWVACQKAAAAAAAVDADKDKSASTAAQTLCALSCTAVAVFPTPLDFPNSTKELRTY